MRSVQSQNPKEEPKKSKAELKAELDLMMAKAAIKHAVVTFSKGMMLEQAPAELKAYWDSLDTEGWQKHLQIFTIELKKMKNVAIKKILFDIEHYIKDCKKLVPGFRRTKEELLLMVAIGQFEVKEFLGNLSNVATNRERLDRKIHKQIKELTWEDDRALERLDELTKKLEEPKIKKDDIEKIEAEIKEIENNITVRKQKRDELAIKLVEWKARGNIDIAGLDGSFRLDA